MTTRATLSGPIGFCGHAVHCGGESAVRLHPAESGGVRFKKNGVVIPAHCDFIERADFGVVLKNGGVRIGVVEHLLATLYVRGITDVLIEAEGAEVPILDGSAQIFAEVLNGIPLHALPSPAMRFHAIQCDVVSVGERKVTLSPHDFLHVAATIDYAHPAIGVQQAAFDIDWPTFREHIAPARTFGFRADWAQFQKLGLAKGVSLDCSLIFEEDALNGKQRLRFSDEPVRHKILDLLGDLSLCGMQVVGRLDSVRGGHALNTQLARNIAARAQSSSNSAQ